LDDSGRLKRLTEENEHLKEAIEELKILNDIATAISSTMSLEGIMSLIVQKCIEHLHAEQGAIMVLDPNDKTRPFHTMIRKADRTEFSLPYKLDIQLMGWMLKHRQPLIVSDLKRDDRFELPSHHDDAIRSLLSVPLMLKGRIIGSLNVFNKRPAGGFSEGDKRLLAIIATESAQVIENARLYEEEQALFSIREEMRLAYKIQMDLLPKCPPRIRGYDIAAKSMPAKEVGGDYYDFIEIHSERFGVCLGDVSGKGMPAALLMANLQATLRSNVAQDVPPCECLRRSNELIFRSTDSDRFATLFYGVLDPTRHTLSYCNAGHNHPFLIRKDREPARLETGGTVLGTFFDAAYREGEVSFDPGDVLFVYSDGLVEAIDPEQQEFGEARLYEAVISNRSLAAERLLEKVIEGIRLFTGKTPQQDDMTVMVIRRER
jgi:sigma-B regulation protein RsbU (phosphoserine phosphatase)